MQRDRRDVEQGLLAKGFEQDDRHHRYFLYRTLSGELSTIKTYTSHSGKSLGDPLLALMARQCGLNKSDFLGLIDCPMSRVQFEDRVGIGSGAE